MSTKLLMNFRQALLMMVDAIERELDIKPRTSKLRRFWKDWRDSEKGSTYEKQLEDAQ